MIDGLDACIIPDHREMDQEEEEEEEEEMN